MPGRDARSGALRVGAGIAVALAAAVALAVALSGAPPEGPVRVDYDHTRCAHCQMLVSSPGFAAQLHLQDGSVRHYDDPGCLLAARAGRGPDEPAEHAAWVHHWREDRWLPLSQAAFVEVPHSPMGYRLAAVDRAEAPDGLDAAAATARVLAVPPTDAQLGRAR